MIRVLFSLLLISLNSIAQQAQMNVAMIKALHNNTSKTYDVLVRGNVDVVKNFTSSHNGLFKYNAGTISSVSLTGQAIQLLAKNPQIKQIEYYVNHTRTLDDTSNVKNNVVKVHNGAAPLSQAYNGSGVIFGFIDTGIDFRHPDFKDSTGKTRIKYLWAQQYHYNGGHYTGGITPQPYNYGMEWDSAKIDNGLCDFQDSVAFAHGTRVAGIAAGNGNGNPIYKGVATKADIMCVALNFNSNGPVIADAVNYLVDKANAANKPLVINISLGDYYGSHDGQDLQAMLIDSLTANIPGRCVVAAVGDAGNIPFHLKYNVTSDTNITFSQNTSANQFGYGLFADTTNFKNVKYTIGVYNGTTYQYEGNIHFRNVTSCLNTVVNDTLKFNGNRIGIIQTASAITGKTYELDFNIIADSSSYFWTLETTGSGSFDAWDFEYLPISQIPSGLASIPRMAYYKAPDIDQTICTSFQCSNNVITMGNYVDRTGFTSLGGVFSPQAAVNDTLAVSSSVGPTRDGRIKPEVAAPGDNIVASGALWSCKWSALNYPTSGSISQDTLYTVFGGASASSPNAAGVVALYLQKYPTATNLQIKQAITTCTTIDLYTGTNLPNNSWGYGKLNAFGALTCNTVTTSISQHSNLNAHILVYPNPAQQQIQFVFDNDANNADVIIYSLLGEEINNIHTSTNNVNVPVQQLADGLYLYKIVKNKTLISQGKFIKN